MNRLPDSVERRLANGDFERVAVRRIVAGDVIRVLPGEAFPADGRVLEGQTLADEALLTGESRPVPRAQGEDVIAGSHNLTAAVLVQVERTGTQTRFAQIVALMDEASSTKPQIAQLADRPAFPDRRAVGSRRCRPVLVVTRSRPRTHGGGGRAGGHLPLRPVVGHSGGDAGQCRRTGAQWSAGAPASGAGNARHRRHRGIRQDWNADA